jgi:hypothetical protein
MTHRYTTDSRWMHDHWTSMADDEELTITAGGLRQWMAEYLARSLGQPIAVEEHYEPAEEPAYELEDHQDEAGPTLHEGNQPEPAAPAEEPAEEPSFLNRFLEALSGESASAQDYEHGGDE